MTVEAGREVGVLCPDCQTPAENAEGEVNQATLIYSLDDEGRLRGTPRG